MLVDIGIVGEVRRLLVDVVVGVVMWVLLMEGGGGGGRGASVEEGGCLPCTTNCSIAWHILYTIK